MVKLLKEKMKIGSKKINKILRLFRFRFIKFVTVNKLLA